MDTETIRELMQLQTEIERFVDYRFDGKHNVSPDLTNEWALNILFMVDNLLNTGECWPEGTQS